MLIKFRQAHGQYTSEMFFVCALCDEDLTEKDKVLSHPTHRRTGFFFTREEPIQCSQIEMKAMAAINLPEI